LVADGSSTR